TLLATNLSHPIGMNETAERRFGKTNARKLASTEQLASFLYSEGQSYEELCFKVLSGSTLAVALAVAAPVWAQTPSSQSSPGGAPSSTAPYSQSAPSATAPSPYTPSAPSTLSQSTMPPSSSSATTSAPYSTTENAAEPKRGRHVTHRA